MIDPLSRTLARTRWLHRRIRARVGRTDGGGSERSRREETERNAKSETEGQSSTDDRRPRPRPDGGETVRAVETDGWLARLRWSAGLQAAIFWVPPFVLMGWFVYGAIGWNFLISLTDWSGLGQPQYETFNLEMYARMLEDRSFVAAARNTVVLLIAFTGAALGIGLLLAILVDQGIRFENTFRTIYLLPMSLSFVVTAIFWAWMYNPETGMINVVLGGLGADALAMNWMSDPRTKLFSIILALTWQFSGYCMIVYLAGLRTIPDAHYEAARVDGASTVRMYWRVILPQLQAATTSAAIVLMVFSLKAFDFIFVMYGDTPGPSADILAVMMFREAFSRTNWAYGSAIAMVLFLLALAVIAPYIYMQYRRGEL
ncbi:sugar ABC transporter permease [Natronoglomus mannanivorans]|uniref:Sugar ABC transporter permease n=1 Tax=Natronoglomus mannanivorans TaxID=2979990 RepID=A0AAP2YVX3_9EURY|nr:sugar ABC transporter permease [Halobacteria archaeon AArc-xg1-1]